METNVQEIKNNLSQFHGSNLIYEEKNFGFLYTEGIHYMVDACKAVWLLTDSGIQCKHLAKQTSYIRVRLIKNADSSAVVIYTDGNNNEIFRKEYFVTDFPLEEIIFWFVDNTLLLPSEY